MWGLVTLAKTKLWEDNEKQECINTQTNQETTWVSGENNDSPDDTTKETGPEKWKIL